MAFLDENGLTEVWKLIKAADAKINVNNLVIEKIFTSRTWTAPKAADQRFKIFCVGGGGGGSGGYTTGSPFSGGGGGGGGAPRV